MNIPDRNRSERAEERVAELEAERAELMKALSATIERMERDGYEPPHLGGALVVNGRALLSRLNGGKKP